MPTSLNGEPNIDRGNVLLSIPKDRVGILKPDDRPMHQL